MRFLTANDAPGVHAPSWYAATAGDAPAFPPLRGATRADVAIVGGGYAGLSAALHLAQAGLDVALVDAHRVGWGASGRNGGQLSFGPRADIRTYERMMGPEDAARIWAISTEATRLAKRLVAAHGIDCDLRAGHLEAAWRDRDLDEMRAYADHVGERYGHRALAVIGPEEFRARVDSPVYRGGMEDGEAGHLHPLRYAHGLARAAHDAGARLHERSPALEAADGLVRTEGGEIRADWVILACNGYVDGLDRGVAARVMPINNFIVATERLGGRNPVPGGECVCDTRFVINYFRPTPDGRLLFGGGETYSHRFPPDPGAPARAALARVFPQLADARIEHAWGGTLAITRNRMPLFHRPGPRRLAIGGWSGAGVHMATMGGAVAAEAVRGAMERWDVLARAPTPPFPGGDRLRPALLRIAMAWYALRDRL